MIDVENKNTIQKLHTFEDVEELFFSYISNEKSRILVRQSYEFAKECHKDQYRRSGEPYIHHLIEVCYILAQLNCGPSTLCAGLLHDVVEDTDVSLLKLEELFGSEISRIVDSLTKIQRLKLSHTEQQNIEYEDRRKIFLGMAKDIRVIVIKLADRLHNMRTLDSLTYNRQIAIAKETQEVFAPIAHRLGINSLKNELEDLSLKYLKPDEYNEIVTMLNNRMKNRMKSLENLRKKIADILYINNISFQIESRVKTIYSIYRKIYIKGYTFDSIFDVLAVRIITETELNCYESLGIIHATYKPIPGRFKDYIAVPKPNMYQSLHTCIVAGDGNIFEVQIRTKDMDAIAESGIAAHWRYKEGNNYNAKAEQKEIEEKLHWFRDFVNLSEEDYDAKDYIENLSKDIFEANVYVFTPKGKVIDLPSGSTPLDFAFKIHTKVGESAVGAIVNNSMVSLNTVLKTGDVVEIKTSKNTGGVNEGWLKIAKTSYAKSLIKKALLKKNSEIMKEEYIKQGKNIALEAFKGYNINETEMITLISAENVLNHYNVGDINELYIALSNKNPSVTSLLDYLNIRKKDSTIKLSKDNRQNNLIPVYIENAGNIALSLARCCGPIPGDEIIGYISKGKGVVVHRKNCPNVSGLNQRLIDVYWKDEIVNATYPVDINIECIDRPNLLLDIVSCLSQQKIPVTSINGSSNKETMKSKIVATIFVKNSESLKNIFNIILNIKNVINVHRIIH